MQGTDESWFASGSHRRNALAEDEGLGPRRKRTVMNDALCGRRTRPSERRRRTLSQARPAHLMTGSAAPTQQTMPRQDLDATAIGPSPQVATGTIERSRQTADETLPADSRRSPVLVFGALPNRQPGQVQYEMALPAMS